MVAAKINGRTMIAPVVVRAFYADGKTFGKHALGQYSLAACPGDFARVDLALAVFLWQAILVQHRARLRAAPVWRPVLPSAAFRFDDVQFSANVGIVAVAADDPQCAGDAGIAGAKFLLLRTQHAQFEFIVLQQRFHAGSSKAGRATQVARRKLHYSIMIEK